MFAPDLPTSVSWGANHHLFYSVANVYGNIGMIWGASSPCAKRMHVYPEITLNSCACSARALVAVAIWLWLTVVLTTLFMRHLLAVNQSGHPGAIDGAVGLCETCLSEPTHRVSPLGRSAVGSPSVFQRSVSPFSPPLRCLPALPPETWRPLNPWYNHRFFGSTFVILRPPGSCNGVFHTRSCRWLGPDIHVVFIASPQICVCPISTDCQSHQSILLFSP